MEKAFGFVMDCYGARDGGVTAYEISQGNYHVGYNSFMEIKEGNELKKGTLLTTDLFSYSFPFIRYELGDEVSFSTSTTSDYNGQVISKVLGRASDIIRLENGHVLTGVGFQVMFGRMNVIAFRISKVGELHLLVEIEPNEYFTKDEENLIRTIFQNHAGQNCNIEIYKVKKFTPNKNGKRNYFMS
ncbi:MAG: phenylacetate-CoA ligase [Algoriphagus sp.]